MAIITLSKEARNWLLYGLKGLLHKDFAGFPAKFPEIFDYLFQTGILVTKEAYSKAVSGLSDDEDNYLITVVRVLRVGGIDPHFHVTDEGKLEWFAGSGETLQGKVVTLREVITLYKSLASFEIHYPKASYIARIRRAGKPLLPL